MEITGKSLAYLLYAVTAGTLVALAGALAAQLDGLANVPLIVFFGIVAVALAIGAWRTATDRDDEHLFQSDGVDESEDFVYDSLAPGRMARDRWQRSLRRLSAEGEAHDEEDGD